jgi:hypothetical protein
MRTLAILVLGIVLGVAGAGAAVKFCPPVQQALGVHAAHPAVKTCTCNPCTCVGGCNCTTCSCKACPGKQNQDPKKECGTPNAPAKKGCCEGH